MPHPCQAGNVYHYQSRQRGAALMIMLVIMVMGAATILVSSLSRAMLQIERNKKMVEILAQAKEVVLGYTLSGGGSQRPGELMYPDVLSSSESPTNYDGASEGGCFDSTKPTASPPYTPLISSSISNMRCLGRLPWKNLGMTISNPTENDPTGFMPWYAFSRNLIDPITPINSELLNTYPHPWLTVRDMKGNVLSNRVAFIIIMPGAPLPGQSRPSSPNLGGSNQYLDSISIPAGCGPTPPAPTCLNTYSNYDLDEDFIIGEEHRWIDDPANPGKKTEDPNYNFNDKLIYVTIDELMPLIEKRLAREVKKCLDDYAGTPTASPSHKYPWAAPISPLAYTSTPITRFGRIPDSPVALIPGPPTQLSASNATGDIKVMLDAMVALQTAVNNCGNIGSNASTRAALASAGAALEQAADTVANSQPTVPAIDQIAVTDPAITAAQRAQTISSPTRCEKIYNQYHGLTPSSTSVQSNLANANSGLVGITTIVSTQEDATMASTWPSGCFVAGTYWDDWKRLVLYQVADNYRPNSSAASCGATCLSISGSGNPNTGSGNYRAAIIMAGKKIGSQTRSSETVSEYLELNNINAPANLVFDTYKTSDTVNYSNVNDLVLCLDGKNNCK